MKKIIIIGGGIAGLSAGIYAQKAGFASEIYEKNPVAGGQCMGWNRQGHHIDNCIHWLTGTKKGTELYDLWESLGAIGDHIPMIDNHKFYTSELGDKLVTLWKDLDKTERELLQFAPEDSQAIHQFMKSVRLAECCEMPVQKPMDMMNIFDFIKLGKKMGNMTKVIKEYGNINMLDLGNLFQNPLIRKLLTDYLPKEYIASNFIVSYATVACGNGNLPKDGSLAMTNRIIQKYQKLGGILHTGAEVKKIKFQGDSTSGNLSAGKKLHASGIELADGKRIDGDYVICTTDTAEAFGNLMDASYMDKKLKNCYENRKDYPIFSGLQMAFSVNEGVINEETLFVDCEPFQIGKQIITRMFLKSYNYEPEFAPKGKTVLQINISQNEEDFAYWKSLDRQTYVQQKQAAAEIVKERTVSKYPKLKGNIEILDCWTPLTYERYCKSFHGAYMAFITKKNVKSYTFKGKIKAIPNVFIASQWLQSPGGLPVAATSGKFAIQRILKKEGKSILI